MSSVQLDSDREQLALQLECGLTSMEINLDKGIQDRLLDYLILLQKWNRVYNLTAIRDPQKMVSAHLLDSLAALPFLPHGQILDVGAGAGLPGIPLAAATPQSQFSLIDSNQKKSAFLRQAVAELKLTNLQVLCLKVEAWLSPVKFNCIISRAFADLSQFIESSKHLLTEDGIFAALKGRYPAAELDCIPEGYATKKVIELHIPRLNANRHLVLIGRS